MEKPVVEKSTAFTDFLSSPAMLLAIPIITPALVNLLKPKDAPQQTSMKEMIETVTLLKGMMEPATKEENDGSFMSTVSKLIETMGAPIAAGAMALQNKQTAIPANIPANNEVDKAIQTENESRALAAPGEPIPEGAKKGEEFLKSVVGLAIKGAKRGAPAQDYAGVIVDQVEPEQLEEFNAFLNDPNCFAVLVMFEPQCAEHKDWFIELVSHLQAEIQAEIEDIKKEELTETNGAPIVEKIPDTDAGADSDANPINEPTNGGNGDAGNVKANEEDGT